MINLQKKNRSKYLRSKKKTRKKSEYEQRIEEIENNITKLQNNNLSSYKKYKKNINTSKNNFFKFSNLGNFIC